MAELATTSHTQLPAAEMQPGPRLSAGTRILHVCAPALSSTPVYQESEVTTLPFDASSLYPLSHRSIQWCLQIMAILSFMLLLVDCSAIFEQILLGSQFPPSVADELYGYRCTTTSRFYSPTRGLHPSPSRLHPTTTAGHSNPTPCPGSGSSQSPSGIHSPTAAGTAVWHPAC